MSSIIIECSLCGNHFERSRRKYKAKAKKHFCPQCIEERKKPRVNFCLNCGRETTNPKFCSRSCSASYNDRLFIKRKKFIKTCKVCGVILEGRKTVCDNHNKSIVDWTKVTYSDISYKRNYQKNSRIRTLARDIYRKSGLPTACTICGYEKHHHICHIKPINSFSNDTPVSIINDINNLVCLCPNHHWELDNGHLTL